MMFSPKIMAIVLALLFCSCLFAEVILTNVKPVSVEGAELTELSAKLKEISGQELSAEAKAEMYQKLATEYGLSIVIPSSGPLVGDVIVTETPTPTVESATPPEVWIMDKDNQIIDAPELLDKVMEVLGQDLSEEEQGKNITKLAGEHGVSIIIRKNRK